MANNANITHQWGSLPDGYQPSDANDFVQKLSTLLTSYVAGSYTLVNYGDSTPSADDQDKPWIRTNSGAPDRVYTYYNGKWVCLHEVPQSGNERRLWVGANDSTLWSYDGGDGNDPSSVTPTDTTGAMWQVDAAFAARFPVGAGTFDSSGAVAVTGTSTDTAVSGEDKHTLTEAELAAHTHSDITADSGSHGSGSTDHDGETVGLLVSSSTSGDVTLSDSDTDSAGSGNAHNNLPPFYGVFFIKRTARKYRTTS